MYSLSGNLELYIHGNASKHTGSSASYMEEISVFLENVINNGPEVITIALLPGLTQMQNIHPLIVHFPIALLSMFALMDLFGSLFYLPSWRRAASWFLYSGTISAILTVLAGFQAAATVPHNDAVHQILQQHQLYGITVAALATLLSIWRILSKSITSFANFIYQLLALGLITAMILGADLGGLMVFKHGVATAAFKTTNTEHQHNHHDHSH